MCNNAVPLQKWLHECASVLLYCLYCYSSCKPRGKVPHDKIRLSCISVLPDILGSRFEGKNSIRINGKYFSTLTLLTPNDHYSGRTAPLTSKRCILYIYSKNIGTEYFKHWYILFVFFSLQKAVCFIILTYLVPVLFTCYIQGVLKLKKNNSGAKRLTDL